MTNAENKLVLVSSVDFDGAVDNMLRPSRAHYNDHAIKRTEEGARRLFDRISVDQQDGDELWWAHSIPFDPSGLLGDEGVALVRAGQVVRYERLLTY